MPQDRFWTLLAKKLSGEASITELEELEMLMRDNPEWVSSAQHIQDLWKMDALNEKNKHTIEDAFIAHLNRLKKEGISTEYNENLSETFYPAPRAYSKRKWLVMAAALVTVALAGFYMLLPLGEVNSAIAANSTNSEVSTRLGSKTKLVLPDSSTVWLNAGSKLLYNAAFGNNNREVSLSGEAYFEVKKGRIPFIIHTPSIQIKVVGTAFNLKSYPHERTTETTIIRGKVEITINKRPGEKFILTPSEKLIVANELKEEKGSTQKVEPLVVLSKFSRTEDNSIIESSWIYNKLVFSDESFNELITKMERWYGVEIEIKDPELSAVRFTGIFENETIQEALDALQLTTSFRYTINKNIVLIQAAKP